MLVLLMTVFILFALFCAGRVVRPLMLPAILIMTLGYVLHWAGVFSLPGDDTIPHRQAPHSAGQ